MTTVPSWPRRSRARTTLLRRRPPSTLLLLTAALVGLPAMAAGQSSGTTEASVNVNARVYRNLTIAGTQDLEFGAFYPTAISSGSSYSARNATISAPSQGAQPAYFTITGHGAAEINIDLEWSNPVLVNPATVGPTLTLSSVGAQLFSDDGASTPIGALESGLQSGDSFSRTLSGSEAAETTNYLFVQATVTPTEAQAPGTYLGTITVTVNYTGS